MSIQDRDWYRKEMADRMRQSNPTIRPSSYTPASRRVSKTRNVAAVLVPVIAICALYPFAARLLRNRETPTIVSPTIAKPDLMSATRAAPTADNPATTPPELTTAPATATDQSSHCIEQAQAVMQSGAPPEALGRDWLNRCKTYIGDLPSTVRLWTLRDPADF